MMTRMSTAESETTFDDIVAYLTWHGWIRHNGGRVAEIWRRLEGPDEVLVPRFSTAADFSKRLAILTDDLAKIERRDVALVREDLGRALFDVSDVVVVTDANQLPSLELGVNAFSCARKAVIAAAAATIRRQGHFGRSMPDQARQQASHVGVGHTRTASYVVPIISRARSIAVAGTVEAPQLDFETEELLFDRRVMITLSRALGSLSNLTEESSSTPRVVNIVEAVGDGVSRELCRAVSTVLTKSDRDVKFSFRWAPAVRRPSTVSDLVEFPREARPNLEHVATVLKQQADEREDVLYGVVVSLEQRPEDSSATVGVLTIVNRRQRMVLTQLNPEQHEVALQSYSTKQRIVMRGRLRAPKGGEATMAVSHFEQDESVLAD